MKKYFFSVAFLFASHVCFCTVVDSLETALKTATGEQKVKVMNELFRALINSDPVRAISYTREALTLATSIDDKKGMGASYNNLGVAYRNQGALDMALENYMKALELYTGIQNAEGMATAKNNIGTIYSMKKDFGQALKFFEESHNGFVALAVPEKIIGSMNNMGNLHSDLQLYDQALNYYNEAWKMSEKNGGQFADPLSNIGNLYYRQGNYQRAKEYYDRALVIVRKQNNRISELSILANLGEVFVKANQPSVAQGYLDQALTMANELQASFFMPQILRSMAANYAKQGKMEDAYETMIEYDKIRESVYGEESSRKIAQLEVALQLKEKEDEIVALQISEQNKSLKLRNTQIVITAVVLAVVSVVAIFNLFLIGKRIRKTKYSKTNGTS